MFFLIPECSVRWMHFISMVGTQQTQNIFITFYKDRRHVFKKTFDRNIQKTSRKHFHNRRETLWKCFEENISIETF